jgi:TPR repeat protein
MKKAAEYGDSDGMINYRTLLWQGFEGSPPNRREAILWYKKAGEAGSNTLDV